jgi:hypothetical protein
LFNGLLQITAQAIEFHGSFAKDWQIPGPFKKTQVCLSLLPPAHASEKRNDEA